MARTSESPLAGRWAKLRKAYPSGPLPEEEAAAVAAAGAAATAWAELADLERQTAAVLEAAVEAGALPAVAVQVADWIGHYLTDEGLFGPDPWATYRLLPRFDRLRQGLEERGWETAHETAFWRLLGASLRTAAPGGWLPAARHAPSPAYVDLVRRLVGQPAGRQWSNVAGGLWSIPLAARRAKPPAPGFQSDTAGIAVLRRDWSAAGAVVAADFSQPPFDLTLRLFDRPVIRGPWELTVACNGRPMPLLGAWEATCWFTDEDSEYLELRRLLGGGLVLERQLFLARRVPLLWLSDTLKSPLAEPLALTWHLPLPTAALQRGELPALETEPAGAAFERVRWEPNRQRQTPLPAAGDDLGSQGTAAAVTLAFPDDYQRSAPGQCAGGGSLPHSAWWPASRRLPRAGSPESLCLPRLPDAQRSGLCRIRQKRPVP